MYLANFKQSWTLSNSKWCAGRSATPLADLQRHYVEDLIGCGVRDMGLYRTALSAPSAVEPDHMIAQSFDRIEYLGDAVVQIVFGSYIYQRYLFQSTCLLTI